MIRSIYALMLIALPFIASAQDRVLTLSGMPIWDSAPLLYLVETQPLKEDGIRFAFEPWRAPEELGAGLARQDINIASAPGMLAPIFANRGLELWLLGTSAPAGNIKIVSVRSKGEIAVPFKGGMPDMILRSIGIPQSLTPRYTGTPTEAMQLLLSGQVASAFLAEPMATIVEVQSGSELEVTDTCDLWKSTHGLDHCPATGIYLGSGLMAEDVGKIALALSTAHATLADDPVAAATLLQAQFTMLERAPLIPAFTKIAPAFQPMCDTSWIMGTLQVLEPLAPYSLGEDRLLFQTC